MNSNAIEPSRNAHGAADAAAVGASSVLLRNLIDYAGLFPPASLSMYDAVANYDLYSRSEHSWILGRFIVPATRLAECADATARPRNERDGAPSPKGLSVLLGADFLSDIARIREFNAHYNSRRGHEAESAPVQSKVQSVEVKIGSPAEVERISRALPAELETYLEIPWSNDGASNLMHDCIAAVADCGRRAKLRTGGETADKFPAPATVLEFIRLCAEFNVPFKATAGLHHPLRSRHRLTYQPDSPSGTMHGFLNVFLASAFLHAGMEPALALDLLNEQSADAFEFGAANVAWRNHQLSADDLAATRESFAISFGSCSFTEPIDDLRALKLL
jgi:hypothetical protein